MTRNIGIIQSFINLLFIGSVRGLGSPGWGFGGPVGPGSGIGGSGFTDRLFGEWGLFMGFGWLYSRGGFEGGQVGCLLWKLWACKILLLIF